MFKSQTVKCSSLLFPLFTKSNADAFNTNNKVICNLIQKFSSHLEQSGYAIQKEIYTFIFPTLLGKLVSSRFSILAQLLSVLRSVKLTGHV